MPKRLYVAIVILLIAMMAMSFLPVHGEREVYDTVVRLHVLANSDSEEDQALKLEVRDAVLEAAAPYLEGCTTQAEAIQSLTPHLSDLEAVAAETGCYYLDTQSVLKGEDGCLRAEYCNSTDGIHLGVAGYEAILAYIRTHAVTN